MAEFQHDRTNTEEVELGGWGLGGFGKNIENIIQLALMRSVYDENFSSIGAIVKKLSWGLGVGGCLG